MKRTLATTAFLLVLTLCISGSSAAVSEAIPMASEATSTALEALHVQDIIDGYEDGQLHPERQLTRAQFAKFLNRAFPDTPTTEKQFNFSDLDRAHWAYADIQRAANAGWLEGFPDGTFRPDTHIAYEQAVTVLCRVLRLMPFGAAYPTDYLAAGIEYAITDGVDALIGEEVNREQAAQLLLNALQFEDGQLSPSGTTSNIRLSGGVSGGAPVAAAPGAMVETMAMADSADGAAAYVPGFIVEAPFIPENREEYAATEENIFKNVLTSPLSTFSIDTDTASYSNLRRFILNGQPIANGAVRTEELLNYFDYTRAQTEAGKPFGVNYTVAPCPWNTENLLAMVTVSGEALTERQPSNLVFLIDTSGSMYSNNKLPLVKQALSMLLDTLGEADTISIVTYASGTGVALPPTPATEKEKILDVINNLQAGGATAGASGISLAYEQAEKYKTDGNNRIILCTDGDFNVGISSETELEQLITEKREGGIFLSVLGFGMGNYKDSKMEILADCGNGNYAYIDNLREAKKVLVDEMPKTIYTIAKDVKIQVEFNPEQVSQYRLVGYENRLLENEDFENDAKDAGELGAGATVTVLYEIVPASGIPDNPLKYQTPQGTGSDELMTVKIRYKLPDGDESVQADYPIASQLAETVGADFSFAAAVAELGMLLNDSAYKGNATFDTVIELAKAGVGEDPFGLRTEFIQLVDLLRYKN